MFEVGDRVRLLRLDEWFFDGIPAVDVEFLRSCVGRETALVGFDEYGHAELEFARSTNRSHTVWVDASWIEKA